MLIKGDPAPTHMIVQWAGPFSTSLWSETSQVEREIRPGETVRLPLQIANKLLAEYPNWWKPPPRLLGSA